MRMVVWREAPCGSKLFWAWGAYGLAMMGLWQMVRAAGLPDVISWALAGALAWCLLGWTLEA
jgi:hypothetical protein